MASNMFIPGQWDNDHSISTITVPSTLRESSSPDNSTGSAMSRTNGVSRFKSSVRPRESIFAKYIRYGFHRMTGDVKNTQAIHPTPTFSPLHDRRNFRSTKGTQKPPISLPPPPILSSALPIEHVPSSNLNITTTTAKPNRERHNFHSTKGIQSSPIPPPSPPVLSSERPTQHAHGSHSETSPHTTTIQFDAPSSLTGNVERRPSIPRHQFRKMLDAPSEPNRQSSNALSTTLVRTDFGVAKAMMIGDHSSPQGLPSVSDRAPCPLPQRTGMFTGIGGHKRHVFRTVGVARSDQHPAVAHCLGIVSPATGIESSGLTIGSNTIDTHEVSSRSHPTSTPSLTQPSNLVSGSTPTGIPETDVALASGQAPILQTYGGAAFARHSFRNRITQGADRPTLISPRSSSVLQPFDLADESRHSDGSSIELETRGPLRVNLHRYHFREQKNKTTNSQEQLACVPTLVPCSRVPSFHPRFFGNRRPPPPPPTRPPKRSHKRVYVSQEDEIVVDRTQEIPQDSTGNIGLPAHLDLISRKYAILNPDDNATISDLQTIVGLVISESDRMSKLGRALEEYPNKRRRVDFSQRAEIHGMKGVGIRIHEQRREDIVNKTHASIRRAVAELMHRKAKAPIPTAAVATQEELSDFANCLNEGPTEKSFKLQFGPIRATPWNERAIDVVRNYMFKEADLRTSDQRRVDKMIKTHIDTLAIQYAKEKSKRTMNRSSLTDEEDQRTLARDQRRRNLHHRRKSTVFSEPELQRYTSLWESLPYTVNSGDETDCARGGAQRRVRTKPAWRSPTFSEHCQRMDDMYLHKRVRDRGFSNPGPGSFPGLRLKGGSRIQRDKGEAPVGLPINCYDIKWMKTLSAEELKKLEYRPAFDFAPDARELAISEIYEKVSTREDLKKTAKTSQELLAQKLADVVG